jgi:hypothetical protein
MTVNLSTLVFKASRQPMTDSTLTLTVHRHTTNPQREYISNTDFDNSDGAEFCYCQRNFSDLRPCLFYGRNLGPLSCSIAKDRIYLQAQCNLLTSLPVEIRETIWEYALTDITSVPNGSIHMWRGLRYPTKPDFQDCDMAIELLRSCKAIYLETY